MPRFRTIAYILLLWLLKGWNNALATYPIYKNPPRLKNDAFLPAKPGETPNCVKDPRLTYCTEPKNYPKDRILYLIKNNMFDMSSLLQDETRDTYTFEARDGKMIPASMYGPPPKVKPTSSYSSGGYSRSLSSRRRNNRPNVQNSTYSHPWSNSPTPSTYTNHYGNKVDNGFRSGRNFYGDRTTPFQVEDEFTRYQKNGFSTSASPNSSPAHHYWWKKREKRQANLDDLCPSQANYIMPRAAQNIGGDWMYLVNVGSQYTQLVKSEVCTRNTCEGSCDIPDGFSAICQQQYVQKRLVALDGSGSNLNSDTFWFPSCCVCKIRPG